MRDQAKTIRTVALGCGLAYSAVLYLSGINLEASAQRLVTYVPTVAVLMALAFDLWIWKWPGVSRLTGRPRIDGTWETALTPTADSHIPDGGNKGPIHALTIIEQSFWTLSIRVLTEQSRSTSTTASLIRSNDSKTEKVLYYTYTNHPKMAHRPRSLVHLGSCELIAAGNRPTSMYGYYWTNRLTMGDVVLQLRNRRTDSLWTDGGDSARTARARDNTSESA